MPNLLSVSDVVNVQVTLSPIAAQFRNFGDMLILGSTSGVIDTSERLRLYTGITGVSQDFGTTTPEYLAAQAFFSQSPQPVRCYVGRWAQTASKGVLHGAPLTPAQQLLSNFTGITTGSLRISVDGVSHDFTGLNFSTALNMNGVAMLLQTALNAFTGGFATCVVLWNATYSRFDILSGTTGTSSSVSYGSVAASGVDTSTLLGLTAAAGASAPVIGIAAETLLAAVTTLMNQSSAWYGLTIAAVSTVADADHVAVAQAINAAQVSRIYAVTIQNPVAMDPTSSSDLGASLQTAQLSRVFSVYSSTGPYAAASALGRLASIDYSAQNSAITMKFKQLPGITPEQLTESQAATLQAKNINTFAAFMNGTQIFKEGVMANGYFIDERVNTDWFQNTLQTQIYNVLYQSPTKIPQTDDGINQLVTAAKLACVAGVNNGFIAPGVWNGPPIGKIRNADPLPLGYYIYAPSVDFQLQADREARKAPTMQILIKEAGAVHFANVVCNVNR
jgi:hypothetical protein